MDANLKCTIGMADSYDYLWGSQFNIRECYDIQQEYEFSACYDSQTLTVTFIYLHSLRTIIYI